MNFERHGKYRYESVNEEADEALHKEIRRIQRSGLRMEIIFYALILGVWVGLHLSDNTPKISDNTPEIIYKAKSFAEVVDKVQKDLKIENKEINKAVLENCKKAVKTFSLEKEWECADRPTNPLQNWKALTGL